MEKHRLLLLNCGGGYGLPCVYHKYIYIPKVYCTLTEPRDPQRLPRPNKGCCSLQYMVHLDYCKNIHVDCMSSMVVDFCRSKNEVVQ